MSDATHERITRYAEALYEVAVAERQEELVSNELYKVGRAVVESDELRGALTDPHIPPARRQEIVESLLGPAASQVTVALVSMVVAAGRAGDLPNIVDVLVNLNAQKLDKVVAEVRTAIDLTQDQRDRLAAALRNAVGKDIDVKVIVDPTVLGGVVAQIGETVIDGSVRARLAQLKEAI